MLIIEKALQKGPPGAELFRSAHRTNIDTLCTRSAYKVHNLLLFSAVVCTCSAQRVETLNQALLFGEFYTIIGDCGIS